MSDLRDLIDGYFDDTLTAEQLKALSHWIKAAPTNALTFANASLPHDRMHNTLAIADEAPYNFTLPREGRGGDYDDAGRGYDGELVNHANPSPKARSSPSTLPGEGEKTMHSPLPGEGEEVESHWAISTSILNIPNKTEQALLWRTTAAAVVLVAGLVMLWFSIGTPGEAKMLKGRLDQYLTAINAQLPTLNPNYDPSLPVVPGKAKRR